MILRSIIFIFICAICGNSFGQNRTIDSLKQVLKHLPSGTQNDTTRTKTFILLAHQFKKIELDSSMFYYKKAEELSTKHNGILKQCESIRGIGMVMFLKGDHEQAMKKLEASLLLANKAASTQSLTIKANLLIAEIHGNIAMIIKDQGEYSKAIEYLKKAIAINTKLKSVEGLAVNYGNLGIIYYEQEDLPKALDNYFLALKAAYQLNNVQLIMNNLGNIGGVYRNLNDLDKAMDYYRKALTLAEKNDNKVIASVNLNNIGIAWTLKGDYLKAIEYHQLAMNINESMGRKGGLLFNLNGLGVASFNLRRFNDAIKYYERAANLANEMGNVVQYGNNLGNIGSIYLTRKEWAKAESYMKKTIAIAEELGYEELQKNEHNNLYELYKLTKRPQEALKHFEIYIQLRDSLINQENVKQSIKKELQFQYEKKATADSVAHAKESLVKNVELAKQKAEIKAKKNQQYALFGGLGLVMIFAGFMYNRFKVTQKQKGIIEEQKEIVEQQKHLVEEKQKEILDSIHYAKRIQMAQIPSEKRVENTIKRLRK